MWLIISKQAIIVCQHLPNTFVEYSIQKNHLLSQALVKIITAEKMIPVITYFRCLPALEN